ncbi:MAG: YbjN domain-containing protein [Rhodospirillaceae bacterium]|nr:YbjN domain-containing protein [Rhodospirillaceae bacterium]MCA8933158.1 YbjN domain-containing protein [Rhodospirillaceae bacterium]
MTMLSTETTAATQNPLELLEEIVGANDWSFERLSAEEMLVEISGRWCHYRLFFFWQDDVSAMQFSCQFDMRVLPNRRAAVVELLAVINERLWLGHFDIDGEASSPMFRHTTLLRGAQGASVEQLEDLIDIAITECDRFFPVFQFVVWGGKSAHEAVSAAILDTVAEA